MKEIVVISGKGGTGKTVLVASFAALTKNKVIADCDVDAADLYLLLHPTVKKQVEFRSGQTAIIDQDKCIQCGKCLVLCRFEAVKTKKNEKGGLKEMEIDPISCEGCGVCYHVCPVDAIKMEENISGELFISETRYGPFIHAKLGIAEENSGKLVTKVRQTAKDIAVREGKDYIISDGPPGIGCPVIASLSGADCALIITEPTLSGLHDARRVADVAKHFNVTVKIVVNKYDLNPVVTNQIEEFCRERGVPVIGKIIFDKKVVEAMVEGKNIVEYSDGPVKDEIIKIWNILNV